MKNSPVYSDYADENCDVEKMLHGAARLHIYLGRMDNENVSTRGWSYNELVSGIIMSSNFKDIHKLIDVLFDTFEALTEIGSNSVKYLNDMTGYLDEIR